MRRSSGGLTPAEVIATFKTIQMVDVHVPTTDGRELVMTRHTHPLPAHRVSLGQLQHTPPEQPPLENVGLGRAATEVRREDQVVVGSSAVPLRVARCRGNVDGQRGVAA